MANRLQLSEMLHAILNSDSVYFQPPESIEMEYPAIVYSLNGIQNTFADNSVYTQSRVYQITIIDEDPDSEIVDKVSRLPNCKFVRPYDADNLHHWVFNIQI